MPSFARSLPAKRLTVAKNNFAVTTILFFPCGRTFTKDEHRSGRSVEVTTPEMIDKIHDMVLSDRRIKVREIVEAKGISQGTSVIPERGSWRPQP